MRKVNEARTGSTPQSESKSETAFRLITEHLLNPSSTALPTAAYQFVERLFGARRMAADHLALIWTGTVRSRDHCLEKFSRILHISKNASIETLDSLRKMGILRIIADYQVCLTDKAFDRAVENDMPFQESANAIQIDDFVLGAALTLFQSDKAPEISKQSVPGKQEPYIAELEAVSTREDSDAPSRFFCDIYKVLDKYPGTPFASSVRQLSAGLDREEAAVFLALLGFFGRHFVTPMSADSFQSASWRYAFQRTIGRLVQLGLAVSVHGYDSGSDRIKKDQYRISPRCAEAFRGYEVIIDFSQLAEVGTFIPHTLIPQKELFFAEADRRGMERLRRAASPEHYDRIIRSLKEKEFRACISAIMAGLPGTGKTELARQIARETGRGLLMTDTAKLYGTLWGESEKNFRHLFQMYRYLCAVSARCPILFMDEADGILGKRITVVHGIDKSENVVQNIILDELNSMPGLFIATTNRLENIDEAMGRRFMFKMEFHLPDKATRVKIWASRFPDLPKGDIDTLADRYELSGAYIDNVASMAIIDGIIDDKAVTLDDLISYCESQEFGSVVKRSIGF